MYNCICNTNFLKTYMYIYLIDIILIYILEKKQLFRAEISIFQYYFNCD